MKKRILSICLGLLLFVTQFPLAFAANEDDLPTSGNCGIDGADVTWRITAPGLNGKPGPDTNIQLTIINNTGQTINGLYIKKTIDPYFERIDYLNDRILRNGEQRTINFTYNNNMLYDFYASFQIEDSFHCTRIPIDVKKGSASITLDENFPFSGFILTISGTGAMADFSRPPWREYISNITEVIIENGVTSIGDYAFEDCKRLGNIKISDSVRSIGSSAFSNTELTNITIPKGVIRINESFNNVHYLTDISVDNDNPAFSSVGGALLNKDGTKLIRCPIKKTSYKIPDTVTSIENSAFSDCEINQVVIPDSVTKIGNSAFSDSSISQIIIPDSVTVIGSLTFSGSNINQIIIPNSVTAIGSRAFSYCKNLSNVTISDYITSIPNGLFSGCTKLRTFKIPDSVHNIYMNAFTNCSSLKEIYLPESITDIDAAFNGCKSLETVYYAGTEEDWNKINIDDDNPELIYAKRIYGAYELPSALSVEITGDSIAISQQGTVMRTTELPQAFRPYGDWNQYSSNIPLVYAARYHVDTGRMEKAFSLPHKIVKGKLRYSLDAPAGTYKVFILSGAYQPITAAYELKLK